MTRYYISNSGRYIGILEYDLMALDPRKDKDLAPELVPEMVQRYDDGDVWMTTIYRYCPGTALKPGAIYRSVREFLDSLLGEQIDCCGGQYGYDYAKDTLMSALENLDRTGELE